MKTSNLLKLAVLASIQGTNASCLYGMTLLPRPKEGVAAMLPNFTYDDVRGPTMWHSLETNDSTCAVGENQSPIDINTGFFATTGANQVQTNIPDQNVTFENLGTNVEVFVNGTTTFGGSTFNLKQFHYHTPSEHRINGEYFPMEIHMVHEAPG